MQFAFLRANRTPLGWFILTFERGKYSHCELIFSDGWSFSCVANEDMQHLGVRKIKLDPAASRLDWDTIELPFIDVAQERRIRDYAEGMLGLPYDVISLLGYVFHAGTLFPNAYICSEACLRMLQYGGYWLTDKFFSPTALYEFLVTTPPRMAV